MKFWRGQRVLRMPRRHRSSSHPRPTGDPMTRETSPERRSIRRHLLGGTVIAMILVGGVGGWAATTQLSGAVIAPGSIVVDTNVKKIQHPTGGVVGELFVRDGQRVSAGNIVLRLDDTVTRANLAIVLKGIDEMTARRARLIAERPRRRRHHRRRAQAVRVAARRARRSEIPAQGTRRPARRGDPGSPRPAE